MIGRNVGQTGLLQFLLPDEDVRQSLIAEGIIRIAHSLERIGMMGEGQGENTHHMFGVPAER